jgi:transglutaminase-like putative cysteine protease
LLWYRVSPKRRETRPKSTVIPSYVPGPGWVDFDPSGGLVGNQNLIRVAVAHHPREAIPLQGTWFGTASDHLAMKVAVKVTAAGATGA